jgi:hypothetical protein
MRDRNRTESVNFRCSPAERQEIERLAQNERSTLSEYVRAATLSYMALRGSKLAWRLLGESLSTVLQEAAVRTAALDEAERR